MTHERGQVLQTARLTQIRLEGLRVDGMGSSPRGCLPRRSSREVKARLEECSPGRAVISVAEQIKTWSGVRFTIYSRAEFSLCADMSQSQLERHLPELAECAAPVTSELVAYLSKRMGLPPEILPPTYVQQDARDAHDGALQMSALGGHHAPLGKRQIRPVFATDVLMPTDFQVTGVRLVRLSAQTSPEHSPDSATEHEVAISWTPSLIHQEGQQATVELLVSVAVGNWARIDATYQIESSVAPDVQPEMVQLPPNLNLIARHAGPFVSQTIASLTTDLGLPPLVLPSPA